MVAMYIHGRTRETEETANRAAGQFADFLRGYVTERRKNPGDDLLSLLISAQEDGQRLTEDEMVSSAILLLNAGHEATVHQTGNAVRSILAQGGDPGRFFTSAEAAASTVEECLRFDAPLHMFMRYAYQEIEIAPGIVVQPARRSGFCSAWPIMIRAPSPNRRPSGRTVRTRRTCPSAPASISASARRWRGSNCRCR